MDLLSYIEIKPLIGFPKDKLIDIEKELSSLNHTMNKYPVSDIHIYKIFQENSLYKKVRTFKILFKKLRHFTI